MSRNGIGFHVVEPFQHSMLQPIYNLLKDEFRCLITDSVSTMIAFQPRIIVVATDYYQPFRQCLPETAIVWTRHGFSSKNNPKHAVLGCDFACVSSEWVRDDFSRRGWKPRLGFWVTGFVPMDAALNRSSSLTANLPASLGRGQGRPMLLFTPTWNKNLNAIDILGYRWIEAVRESLPHLTVVIKPHPRTCETQPTAIRIWQKLARHDSKVVLISDASSSVFDLLPYADILLTDISSVMFYFLAFDRPLILVNNPRRHKEPRYFDPNGPEWTWRDMGIEIESADELPAAIDRCLKRPEDKAEQRALYRNRVFGAILDGRAASRVAGRLRALIAPSAGDRPWVELSWDRIAATARFDRAKQNAPSMLLRRWSWRLFDRYPRIRYALRRILFPRPRLHNALHRLLDRMPSWTGRSGRLSRHAPAVHDHRGKNNRND